MAKKYIALEETSQEILATLKGMKPKRYGYRVKLSEPSPANRVEYLYDAVGMTPAAMNFTSGVFNYGSWENIWFVRDNFPCMVKSDGTLDYKLNPNDYTKKFSPDNTGAEVASDVMNPSYAGNAMSAIPLVWYRRWTDGDYYYFVCSEDQYDTSFCADVHTGATGIVYPYKYVAMFKGSAHNNSSSQAVLRSLMSPGVLPDYDETDDTAFPVKAFWPQYNTSATTELTEVQRNDGGNDSTSVWTLKEWSVWCLIADLCTLMGKSTNSQAVFGQGQSTGYVNDAAQHYGHIQPGTLYNLGQFYGYSATNKAVKVFHLENWWAGRWDRIVGLIVKNGTYFARMNLVGGNYNFTGDGYTEVGDVTKVGTGSFGGDSSATDKAYGGYVKQILANRYGYFPTVGGGSETTFECDYFWIRKHGVRVPFVGGDCNVGARCGARCVHCSNVASYANWSVGGSAAVLLR